jgi:dTMP kinase
MKIVTLSGLDGSGKSTQIELLKDYLKSRGKTFFYFHAVEFSIGNKFEIESRVTRDSISNTRNSVTKANWLQIQLRKIALLIDVCRFNRLMRKLKFDYIISDRYFFDTVINIEYLSGSRIKSGMTKWIEERIPKPEFAFFVKVTPETIMQRERKPDQGMEYLVAKAKLFADKIKDWNMIVLNGEKNKEEIFEEIINQVWGEIS